ncbi:MAG: tRNA (N(6)-L-threonylcarbamoyladenosine(37)-C(2))-methylthiotransferase [Methanobacteriaceae archaeon]|nr:tRNA (N(6)-L-threonylcarbamoyladenosine(37)-C(2))-methylthiotransferase [Candidatus Methanorudis spinitermitis]
MRVFIETFGCTFNKADSQIMAGNLLKNNIQVVNSIEKADVTIVNTCYVKQPTESKVTNRIQKIQSEFPEKKLIVSGCMVEIDPKKLEKIAPDSSWIGPHKLKKTTNVVKSSLNGKISKACGFSNDTKVGVPKLRFDPYIHIIQICEGCLGSCSYCCTRFARGSLNSYSISEIKKEAKEAIADGCVEIQLTAQDTAAFGKDTNEKLSKLIEEIATIDGDFRVRIGMMHPKSIGNDLDDLIKAFKLQNVYKFIHLPIQSGCNKILRDMGRDHFAEEYKAIVKKFRQKIPELTIATDIIVGYPTETEKDFNETSKFLKELKPGLIHLSKYKHREGAPSSILTEIPYEVMKRRSKYITKIKSQITKDENKQLMRTVQRALVVEKGNKGGFIAKTNSYIPVIVDDVDIGTFVDIKITEATSTYLRGEKV